MVSFLRLMVEHFFWLNPGPGTPLPFHHDPALVLLSVAVAVASAALGLHLAETTRRLPPGTQRRRLALLGGAAALGTGIWAMHFIGMLALRLPVSVSYRLPLTALSLLPALLAAWVALRVLARPYVSRAQWLASGCVLGLGVGAMHYSGMAAMQLQPLLRHEPLAFVASLALSVALALLALWLRLALPRRSTWAQHAMPLLSALALGLAFAAMHYTGMHAARFIGLPDSEAPLPSGWRHPLALAVALTTLGVGLLALLLDALLRYRALYRRVRGNEERLQALVDTAVDAIVTIDAHGLIQDFNRSAERIFGWSAAEVYGRNVTLLMPEPFRGAHDWHLQRYLQTGQAHVIGTAREVLGVRKDGSRLPLRLAVGRSGTRQRPVFVGFLTDLTALKQTQAQLRIAASVFHHSNEAVLILDAGLQVTDLNPAFERLMGVTRLGAMRQDIEHWWPDMDSEPLWAAVRERGRWQGELAARTALGDALVQHLSIAAVQDGDQPARHFIVVIRDVTQARRNQQELERIALYDALTGLPNRRLLMDRLRQAMAQAQRSGQLLAVCFLDLDGFKQVNDRHGHEAGDILLVEVGRRVQALLRAHDTLARLGGDEMALLLGELDTPDAGLPVLRRVLDAVRQPVTLPGGTGQVSVSLGFALYPLDGASADALLRHADQAMYQSKQAGKDRICRHGARAVTGTQGAPV
ncbi:diguanylate cyclase domain-containing protein [Oryzisolibacter propanilivorax]|nr:diguanylate cyclase [Oryzisolibacter propanilivorax]